MKKLLFFFILSITISEVFASDTTKLKDTLVIGKSTLQWKSDRIVEDIDNNIIYISFNNDKELKIKPIIAPISVAPPTPSAVNKTILIV